MRKIGDKVRVRRIQWYHAMKDCAGYIRIKPFGLFVPNMKNWCGKTLTIKKVNVNSTTGEYWYDVEECGYVWSDWMFDEQPPLQHGEKVIASNFHTKIIRGYGYIMKFMRKNPTNFVCKDETTGLRYNFKYVLPIKDVSKDTKTNEEKTLAIKRNKVVYAKNIKRKA